VLTIRLRRSGAKRDPHYRVVVTEQSTRRDGPFLEIVGHYHPRRQPAEIYFDTERIEVWLGKGAQMSETVGSLYRRVQSGAMGAADSAGQDAALEAAAEAEASTSEDLVDATSVTPEGDDVADVESSGEPVPEESNGQTD